MILRFCVAKSNLRTIITVAGMIELIKEGAIKEGSNVLYVHLGGQPALNAYSAYF